MTDKLDEVKMQIKAWDKECYNLQSELNDLERRKEEVTSRIEALHEMMDLVKEKFFKGDD